MAKDLSNNLISVAGEYFVCAELGRLGYLALLTPKNNPLFDVVVTNQPGTRTVSLQVKTRSMSNKAGWKLGRDIETKQNNPNLYVALVELKESGMPDVWIYEYDTLAERVSGQFKKYIGKAKKDGQPRKDPGFRWHDLKQFTADDNDRKNAWTIITDNLK
ncbi:MAG: aspartate-ammonia lyase [Nitrospirae bacterium]|nr:aspartate-ammonia lyase [Nitrospirota bacterium]